MKDKPDNAPLIVMVIGDHIRGHPRPPEGYKLSSFKRLDAALKKSPLVQRVVWQYGLVQYPGIMAMNMISQGNINTIIIDPFSVLDPGGYTEMNNVEKASDFIFKVRELYPGIVVVLYFDFKKIVSIGSEKVSEHGKLKEIILEPFFVGKRSRLAHYFRLDDKLDAKALDVELGYILEECKDELENYKATEKALFDYDIALSFAGEDRPYADELARCLSEHGVRVFYDSYEQASLWGKDLYTHLHTIYSKKARYCVVFISSSYARKMWTVHERKSAQERALHEREREYILPIRIDDTELPGLPGTISYLHIDIGIPKVCEMLRAKLS